MEPCRLVVCACLCVWGGTTGWAWWDAVGWVGERAGARGKGQHTAHRYGARGNQEHADKCEHTSK